MQFKVYFWSISDPELLSIWGNYIVLKITWEETQDLRNKQKNQLTTKNPQGASTFHQKVVMFALRET